MRRRKQKKIVPEKQPLPIKTDEEVAVSDYFEKYYRAYKNDYISQYYKAYKEFKAKQQEKDKE